MEKVNGIRKIDSLDGMMSHYLKKDKKKLELQANYLSNRDSYLIRFILQSSLEQSKLTILLLMK